MAKAYASKLGLLAMTVVMARGAIAGSGFEGTVMIALMAMPILAMVGFFVGWIAEATVDESVRIRMEKQLAEFDETPNQ